MKKGRFWITKSGDKINISQMTTQHLKNSIAMLERYAKHIHNQELSACVGCVFQGEQAQIEQDNFLENSDWEDYLPNVYDDLTKELFLKREAPNAK